ncbi:hypothetical protein [Nitrospira tepida]|uniref:hypothetical protein n=1 Tax=Nitrospira tepida TaxID=2973512 RepID=UPI00259CF19A|nr:hypothetical protein [Nitrospira tepida]
MMPYPEARPKDEPRRSSGFFIPAVCLAVLVLLPWSAIAGADDRAPAQTPQSSSATEETRKKLDGPSNTPSGGTLPGGPVPGGTVPGGTVPGGTLPGGTVPGGPAPGGPVPGGTVPGGTVPGGPVPGGPLP